MRLRKFDPAAVERLQSCLDEDRRDGESRLGQARRIGVSEALLRMVDNGHIPMTNTLRVMSLGMGHDLRHLEQVVGGAPAQSEGAA